MTNLLRKNKESIKRNYHDQRKGRNQWIGSLKGRKVQYRMAQKGWLEENKVNEIKECN